MATVLAEIRSTIRSVVHLASMDNTARPLQINARQCHLLANKASDTLVKLDGFEAFLRNPELFGLNGLNIPDCTPAAVELLRWVKNAEILVRGCCSGDQWLKVAINQGSLKETFAEILHEIEWHMSVLCSVLVTEGDVLEKMLNRDGELRFADYVTLRAAAKLDLESLRLLLRSSHVCDGEVCEPECLAAKLLAKLNAEERELVQRRNLLESNSPLFLWVDPQHLYEGLGQALGRGSFADVKETKWLGQKFAWKIFKSGTDYNATFKQEIAAMAGLDHPHIVRVVCCSESPYPDDLGIVMELMYKSLYDLLKDFKKGRYARGAASPFSIVQAVDLMLQIADGVRHVHSKNLAHRDLKSQNVLLQFASLTGSARFPRQTPAFVAKIADFGLTKMKNDSTERGNQTLNTGTRKWMAPEVWNIKGVVEPAAPSDRFHPKKIDVYSFGITCYEILSGEEPYQGAYPSYRDLYRAVKAGVRPTLPAGTPKKLAALIERCWDGNPLRRPEFSAICTELRFIKGLLLRGTAVAPSASGLFRDDSALHRTKTDLGPGLNVDTGRVKVQGPSGSNGGLPSSIGREGSSSTRPIKLKQGVNLWSSGILRSSLSF